MVQKRSIPSLDGLRAFSVIFVILGHTEVEWTRHSGRYIHLLRDGTLGVATFFVISGFLITHLLLRELNSSGRINLGEFYFRRAFRIFPPSYAFLIVIGVLALTHQVPLNLVSYISALTYTWNYNLHATSRILGHLWSLSLEEQFYLLWPALLLFFRKRTCLWIAVATVALSPISRVLTYFLLPAWRGHIGMMLHTRIDTIMMGCILALALDLKLWPTLWQTINRPGIALIAAVFALFINQPLDDRFGGTYNLTLGISLQGLCCTIVILYAISHPDGRLGRVLNHPVLRHIGLISYSLYLWQQLFTAHERFSTFPWNILFIFGCAELSYFLIERPSFSIRDRLLVSRKNAAKGSSVQISGAVNTK